MSIEFTFLTQEDVIASGGLDMKMAVEVVEESFLLVNQGKVVLPPKLVMELPPNERTRGRIIGLAGYIDANNQIVGIKWIPSFPANPITRNLPRANALVILNDTTTGMPLAIMDGTIISAIRTGAVAALGAKHLARNDSRTLSLIGLGVQSRTQAMGIATVLPNLKEIRGYRRTQAKGQNVVDEIHELTGIPTTLAKSVKDAVEGTDIIDTATNADEQIVKDQWVSEGSLFIHIGSFVEEEYNVVLKSNKIVVDSWDAVKRRQTQILARMFNEGIIADNDIYASLDEIIAGKKIGRDTARERIFFSPMGMASGDIAIASKLFERARAKGIGQTLRLWDRPHWI